VIVLMNGNGLKRREEEKVRLFEVGRGCVSACSAVEADVAKINCGDAFT